MKYEALDEEKNSEHPETLSWPWFRIMVNWITPLINTASNRSLREDDLWPVSDACDVAVNANKLAVAWQHEIILAKTNSRPPHLSRVIFLVYFREFIVSGVSILGFTILQLMQPFLIGQLIDYVSSTTDESIAVGIFWASILSVVAFLSSSSLVYTFYTTRRLGLSLRGAVMMNVYSHALQLTNASKAKNDIGTTTNLMSVDADKLQLAVQFLHFLWQAPLIVAIAMTILGVTIGPVPAVVGTVFVCAYFTLQRHTAQSIGAKRREMVQNMDQRVSLTSETLQAIRAIKIYAWENSISSRVMDTRKHEVEKLTQYLQFNARLRDLNFLSPPFTAFVVLLTIAILMLNSSSDNSPSKLTTAKALSVLAHLNVMRFPLNLLSQALKFLADGKVSLHRLTTFFLLPTLPMGSSSSVLKDGEEMHIKLNHATFCWEDTPCPCDAIDGTHISCYRCNDTVTRSSKVDINNPLHSMSFYLHDVNLEVAPGELVAIIGSVGSGKSTLISSILGEVPLVSGTRMVKGRIAYAAQTPWIQNLTVRDNCLISVVMNSILFGVDYAAAMPTYHKCLEHSALLPDLSALPFGDLTEIGERGINLSGGQKARVSFCRVLVASEYADIIIMDDPFTAVDGATGNWMFNNGVLEGLKCKTRILVLNSHMHLLSACDRVVILEKGRVVACDTPVNLSMSHGDIYSNAIGASRSECIPEETTSDWLDATEGLSQCDSDFSVHSSHERRSRRGLSAGSLDGSLSRCSSHSCGNNDHTSAKEPVSQIMEGRLVVDENRAEGVVTLSTFLCYFGASYWTTDADDATLKTASLSSVIVCLLVIIMFAVTQFVRVLIDLALLEWTSESGKMSSKYFKFYLVCLGCVVVCVFLRSKILAFFATMGSVLNRFAKDMETVDVNIPEYLYMTLLQLFILLSVLVLCVWSIPVLLVIVIPLLIGLGLVGYKFSCVSRDLKRMEAISRTPVYTSFSETLVGIETVRAFHAGKRFCREHKKRMDRNQQLQFHIVMTQTWLTCRMDVSQEFGGCMILASISLLAVIAKTFVENISTVHIGLALVYTLQLTAMLQRNVQLLIDLQTHFTSVERILDYADIPQEQTVVTVHSYDLCSSVKSDSKSTVSRNVELIEKWPIDGSIVFDNVWMRYRESTPAVLKGISFSVVGGHRVGVCGRTGAGKSSIMQTLFRIVELSAGTIRIDGKDISGIPLHILRSRLAIIPQDPVIFVGTIRFQLDPIGTHDDIALWDVLDKVNLAATVKALPLGLYDPLLENGENLSQGQKQLLCIARALLRRARILVMDEATSAVDPNTDSLIQSVLREVAQKQGTTVLTIAHRLHTVLDFDMILVLDSGKVVEYDSPDHLLRNKNSEFSKMMAHYETMKDKEMNR